MKKDSDTGGTEVFAYEEHHAARMSDYERDRRLLDAAPIALLALFVFAMPHNIRNEVITLLVLYIGSKAVYR